MTEENLRRLQIESPVHSVPVLNILRSCRMTLKELKWRGNDGQMMTCIWCGHPFARDADLHTDDCGLALMLKILEMV